MVVVDVVEEVEVVVTVAVAAADDLVGAAWWLAQPEASRESPRAIKKRFMGNRMTLLPKPSRAGNLEGIFGGCDFKWVRREKKSAE